MFLIIGSAQISSGAKEGAGVRKEGRGKDHGDIGSSDCHSPLWYVSFDHFRVLTLRCQLL